MKLPRLPAAGNILETRYTKEQMREYALKAMAQEREACAKACEAHGSTLKSAVWVAEECAAVIRARGQA